MTFCLWPRHRAGRWRASLLLAGLIAVAAYSNVHGLLHLLTYRPREGDIVFQSLPRGPLVEAIEGITQSPYSHCGVVMRDEDGHWVVHEAIGLVRRTPLHLWIVRGRGARIDAWRWTDLEPHKSPALLASLDRFAGRPYDYRYAPGDTEIYCSELVYKAYRDAFGIEFGTWQTLGELDWRPHEAFIREMESGPPPLDRPMITPVALTRDAKLTKVY